MESLTSISEKAFKARSFDGSEDIIPKSCVFGTDYQVIKSDAYWIAAWILEKKNLQFSSKKSAWFDENGSKIDEPLKVERHSPDKKEPVLDNKIKTLEK